MNDKTGTLWHRNMYALTQNFVEMWLSMQNRNTPASQVHVKNWSYYYIVMCTPLISNHTVYNTSNITVSRKSQVLHIHPYTYNTGILVSSQPTFLYYIHVCWSALLSLFLGFYYCRLWLISTSLQHSATRNFMLDKGCAPIQYTPLRPHSLGCNPKWWPVEWERIGKFLRFQNSALYSLLGSCYKLCICWKHTHLYTVFSFFSASLCQHADHLAMHALHTSALCSVCAI